MKIRRVLTIILVLAIGVCALLIMFARFFTREMRLIHGVFPNVISVNRIFTSYLKANSGCLPADETQLIAQGYLRKIHQGVNEIFWEENAGYIEGRQRWYKLHFFEYITIIYGLTSAELEQSGDLVIDKAKKTPLLLINGPDSDKYHKYREFYQRQTLYLYDQMCENFNSEYQSLYPNLAWTQLHEAVKNNKVKEVESLLKEGADVNSKAPGLFTPLHVAATYGFKEITEYLIQNGADVNAKDTGGFTPIHVAAVTGQMEIAEILMKNGALVNERINRNDNANYLGDNAEKLAERYGHTAVAEVIRKHSTN